MFSVCSRYLFCLLSRIDRCLTSGNCYFVVAGSVVRMLTFPNTSVYSSPTAGKKEVLAMTVREERNRESEAKEKGGSLPEMLSCVALYY